jgi:hypothetical protein
MLSLQIVIVKMIELLILIKLIFCCFIVGKWSIILCVVGQFFVIISFFFIVNGLSGWVMGFWALVLSNWQDRYLGFLSFVYMCNLRCKS